MFQQAYYGAIKVMLQVEEIQHAILKIGDLCIGLSNRLVFLSLLLNCLLLRLPLNKMISRVQYFPRRKSFRTRAIDMTPKSCSLTVPSYTSTPHRTLYRTKPSSVY
ncbi:hypothetical protein OPV22_020801 [Ensete ventricosum]|uniref:Uncharacterized protein n=1 Tax=Ensete ventricosum TaxID=4639 RepID=A0AAV8QKE2_ENSVE|nr:hypothetical protein OPV22_020801 [Ensete ventricosum]